MRAELAALAGSIDWSIARHLALSGFLSGLIGLERAWRGKPAGFRTHLLVSMGATLFMLISIYMSDRYPQANINPGFIAANVVTGLGFLGAGTIMKLGGSVHGLTTAASLWAVGAIGLAVGCNYYDLAIQGTVFVLASLFVFDKLEHFLLDRAMPGAKAALRRGMNRRRRGG
jgi:putative Mg2+ transporter-C (MgtC) family protein